MQVCFEASLLGPSSGQTLSARLSASSLHIAHVCAETEVMWVHEHQVWLPWQQKLQNRTWEECCEALPVAEVLESVV